MGALSRRPAAIRDRLRRHEAKLEELADVVYSKPINEWDLEELTRGRPRSEDGTFSGRRSPKLNPLIEAEIRKRVPQEAYAEVMRHVGQAIAVLIDLMVNSEDERLRVDVAKFLTDHVIGKPKQHVDVDLGTNTKGFLAKALVTRERGTGRLVDAHPVEDTDDD
jgi:hypothetical protein